MEADRALEGLLEPHRSTTGPSQVTQWVTLQAEQQVSRPRRMKRRPALTVEQEQEREHRRNLGFHYGSHDRFTTGHTTSSHGVGR